MSKNATELDLEIWEDRSDGLIFFDGAANFIGCSGKMQKLAGSVDALGRFWRDLVAACVRRGGRNGFDFPGGHAVRGSAKEVEVRCVCTAGGFVAAVALAPRSEQSATDLLLDIFSAHILERRAISRHLHGALTQDLVALSLSLSGMRDEGGIGLSEAIAHVERCCRGVRALSYVLAPPSFLDSSLMETLAWYAGVLRADAGVDFEIEADPLPEDPPEQIKSLFFAALQHMAAAAIWHPQGAKIRVRLRFSGGQLSMRIDCACEPDEPVTESSLIRERAKRSAAARSLRRTAKRRRSKSPFRGPRPNDAAPHSYCRRS